MTHARTMTRSTATGAPVLPDSDGAPASTAPTATQTAQVGLAQQAMLSTRSPATRQGVTLSATPSVASGRGQTEAQLF